MQVMLLRVLTTCLASHAETLYNAHELSTSITMHALILALYTDEAQAQMTRKTIDN